MSEPNVSVTSCLDFRGSLKQIVEEAKRDAPKLFAGDNHRERLAELGRGLLRSAVLGLVDEMTEALNVKHHACCIDLLHEPVGKVEASVNGFGFSVHCDVQRQLRFRFGLLDRTRVRLSENCDAGESPYPDCEPILTVDGSRPAEARRAVEIWLRGLLLNFYDAYLRAGYAVGISGTIPPTGKMEGAAL